MTLTQRALLKTSVFIAGTIGIAAMVSVFYLYFPSVAPLMMVGALYGFFVYVYYGITRRELEHKAQKVEQVLRG
jgi:uncharacterized membrane protein YgaE (UPF0421/DUF939 family)